MEAYDSNKERTLEGETNQLNEKFPPVGRWSRVLVREARAKSGEKGNARRFEVIVFTKTASGERELFVCFYDEDDNELTRERVEEFLSDIYPIYSKGA